MVGQRERVQCQFQMGFRKLRTTTDSIFILRIIIDKYLARKRGGKVLDFCRFAKSF
jgi:hypothetical protein